MTRIQFYRASRLKRRRATADEMEERAKFLINYAAEHGPATVRGLYYQAEVHGVSGIDKNENSYGKIQQQVLKLRREGRLDYNDIADATRWMRKPNTYQRRGRADRDRAHLPQEPVARQRCASRNLGRERRGGGRDL
jgi:hypothetical protein